MTAIPRLPLDAKPEDVRAWVEQVIGLLDDQFNSGPPAVWPGTVVFLATKYLPEGYLLCDGGEYLIQDYPLLAKFMEATWGAATPGSFKVPDLIGKLVVGSIVSEVGDETEVNAGTGAPTVKLLVAIKT